MPAYERAIGQRLAKEDLAARDVFVIPSWKQYSHKADDQSVLFSISDKPAQEALGIERTTTSDDDGFYRLTALPAAAQTPTFYFRASATTRAAQSRSRA